MVSYQCLKCESAGRRFQQGEIPYRGGPSLWLWKLREGSLRALFTTSWPDPSPHLMQSGLHARQHAYIRGYMNCLLWLMRLGADTININTLLSHFPTLTCSRQWPSLTEDRSACSVSEVSVHLLHCTQHNQHFGNFAIGLLHRTRPSPSMQPVLQWKLNKL